MLALGFRTKRAKRIRTRMTATVMTSSIRVKPRLPTGKLLRFIGKIY